ncbi:MAG: hypothetical protein LLG06_00860 [Desulfobacteraceae bacterium]|nr:hypothetical protein [Desulfobacteraceae bacterium]
MKEKIRFEIHLQKSMFHNPMFDNGLDTQELEIRKDPLTGRQSVFNPRLEGKAAVFFGSSDQELIDRIARESEPKCFLCEDRWKRMTPTYPESMVPGGRVIVGETVLFPNLFPVSRVHAVIRVGARHSIALRDFSPELVGEAFRAAREFSDLLYKADGASRFVTLNGNYLGPAGASIPHPHFQMLGSDLPFTHLEELLRLSHAYREAHSTCFWTDLIEKERQISQRFIGETGGVSWLTSFSPQGTNEVLGIVGDATNLREMTAEDFEDLARGFSAVMRAYAALGHSTFNFSLYSGPQDQTEKSFRCFLRIITRQNVYANYRTDDYFLQKLLRNEIILNTPEKLAQHMVREFASIPGKRRP